MKLDLSIGLGDVKDVFGRHSLIFYQDSDDFVILQNLMADKIPALQNVEIRSIVIGDSDRLFDEVAAFRSVYSGFDGHDNVKDGYRNILRGVVHSDKIDARDIIHGQDCVMRYNVCHCNWLIICDIGICCLDSNTRMPQLMKWCDVFRVRINNRWLVLYNEGCHARIEFGTLFFVERIAQGIIGISKIINNEWRMEIE